MSMFERMNVGLVKKAIEIILAAVQAGDLVKKDAQAFAGELHRNVKGRFIHAAAENSFHFDERAMRDVLSDYYTVTAHSLSHRKTVDNILRALRKSGPEMNVIANDIERVCKEESDQDNSPSQAASLVKSANQKVIAGLPETPYMIPYLRKRPTSTAPVLSDQGLHPVCASHAVGKGMVAIFHDCGFDVVEGQEKIINDLVDQVQPHNQAEDPDKFDNEILKVKILKHDKNGEKYDVKVKIDIQTDHTPSPIPRMEAEERRERKIQMIIRAKMPTEHAIFATDYDVQKNHYECINSWANIQPFPDVKNSADVYALDYIQITEIYD